MRDFLFIAPGLNAPFAGKKGYSHPSVSQIFNNLRSEFMIILSARNTILLGSGPACGKAPNLRKFQKFLRRIT
jgi:hypothetical protein